MKDSVSLWALDIPSSDDADTDESTSALSSAIKNADPLPIEDTRMDLRSTNGAILYLMHQQRPDKVQIIKKSPKEWYVRCNILPLNVAPTLNAVFTSRSNKLTYYVETERAPEPFIRRLTVHDNR